MQKTMIKTMLAVAVAGMFAGFASAAQTELNGLDDYYNYGKPIGQRVDWNKLDGNFKFLDGQITQQGVRIDNLETKVDTNEKTLSKIEGAVAGLPEQVEENRVNLGNLKDHVDNVVQPQITQQGVRIDNLETNVQINGDKIAANTALINKNTEELQGKIDTNKADIASNRADIAGLRQDVNNHDTAIKANKTAIEAHSSMIIQNAGDIAANSSRLDKHEKAFKQYKAETNAKFEAVNSRIDSLDDKMKKGFASQAALNGLFQPYNVGKFNVSAAIGGYDSEQAMALGTGYRFNENFAIKAGVASDLGGFDHVTYNIGANFEF